MGRFGVVLWAAWVLGAGVEAHGQSATLAAGQQPAHPRMAPTSPGNWVESGKCLGTDAAPGDRAGYGVSIGAGLIVVGAPYAGDGLVRLFDAHSGVQVMQLTAGTPSLGFGYVTAVEGHTLLVGAMAENDLTGAAYVFDLATGTQLHRLLPDDITSPEYFGNSVDLDGGLGLIGAKWDANKTGAAYLYDMATGVLLRKLVAADGGPGDWFGEWVALSDGVALVGAHRKHGASGAAYLFDVATGAQLAKLQPLELGPGDWFGRSVDIDGPRAVVGAPGQGAGAVYVFDVPTGAQVAKLTTDTVGSGDMFGIDVDLDLGAGLVLVGAYRAGGDAGAAFLFPVAGGASLAEFRAPAPAAGDWLGIQVALSADRLVLGMPGDDDACGGSNCDTGAAWVWARPGVELTPEPGGPLRAVPLPLGPASLPFWVPFGL